MARQLHILVTGASGFLGRELVQMALSLGHQVSVLVRDAAQTPLGCAAIVHQLGGGAIRMPEGVDAVVHLAQSRAYRAFPGDADEMFRVNVAGTQELLISAAQSKVSRFCLVSSGTVYEPFSGHLSEDAPLMPIGNLGATKLAAEVLARPYSALIPVSILRLFTPYGPGQTGRLIPDLISRVRNGQAVTLPADGGGMRFTPSYVDDVCAALMTAVTESWSGTFNVASGEVLTIEGAAHEIGKALGKVPVFARNPSQTLPAPAVIPDLTRLSTRYDLSRFRSFANGLKAMLPAEA